MVFDFQSEDFRNGARIDAAENALISGRIERRDFMRLALAAGLSLSTSSAIADKAEAISATQKYNRQALGKSYDYVVVGSGAAGCPIVGRLAENPDVSILLLEAGGTDELETILDPSVWYMNPGTALDWGNVAEPSPHLNGRALAFAMGKAVGGGTSINACYWVRGHKRDFDRWAELAGDPTWNYENSLELYKKIEDWQGPDNPKYRGKGGKVWVQTVQNPNPLAPAIVKAAAAKGIPEVADHNAETNERDIGCAGLVNATIKDGRRRNMATNYLHPVLDQKNVTVLTGAEVFRLTFNGKRCTGVEFAWKDSLYKVGSNKEVVLSAGALNTPKILMLSGIGDAAMLRKLGIEVRQHLPGVGKNLQDHPVVAGAVWEYIRPEKPKNNVCEATFFLKSDPSLAYCDLQPFLAEVPYGSERTATQFKLPQHGWSVGPGLNRPKSVGSIEIVSADPRVKAKIDNPFLKDESDLKALMAGLQIMRDIGNSPEMKEFAKVEVMPGNLKGKELETFVRDSIVTYRHETSTCKMGRDEMSVVNSDLRVHGMEGLCVADGSILPFVPSGNTMAPIVLVGERMAGILKGSM